MDSRRRLSQAVCTNPAAPAGGARIVDPITESVPVAPRATVGAATIVRSAAGAFVGACH